MGQGWKVEGDETMPRLSLTIAGGLAASLLLAAQSAQAADEKAGPILDDVGKIAGAPTPILGTVMNTDDLNSAEAAQPGIPYGDGFSAEDWQLDESLGKPVIALANKGLAAKGQPSLEAQGVDTGLINQGLSLDGGKTGVGTVSASPAASAVMTGVNNLISLGR